MNKHSKLVAAVAIAALLFNSPMLRAADWPLVRGDAAATGGSGRAIW